MIHTVKGFGIVNKAEIDIFLELSCFFYDPADVGNLISGFSEFTLGRSIINVQSVAKPLIRSHILLNTREFILERSLINVKNVEKPSVTTQLLLNTREFILGRGLINVRIVAKTLASTQV